MSCLYFGSAYIEGIPVQPGDVVAVFKDTICCGAKFVTDVGAYGVRAYGAVSPDPGFSYGEIPEFRIWRAEDETEFIAAPSSDSTELFWENMTYRETDLFAPAAIDDIEKPGEIRLFVLPNPFNLSLEIVCVMPQSGAVSLCVFDILGHSVQKLAEDVEIGAGTHIFRWEPDRDISAGIYFVKLTCGDRTMIRKAALVR